MEVKIKDQDKILDATIEMIDGVMVVSPKIKWKPKVGEEFFFPRFEDLEFGVNFHTHECEENIREDLEIQNGWCFKTEEECQEFCNKLNKAIADVKV